MSAKMLTRLFILTFMVVLPLAWTAWMTSVNPDASISQQIYEMCTTKRYGLAIPFFVGFVCGHLFGSMDFRKDNKEEK